MNAKLSDSFSDVIKMADISTNEKNGRPIRHRFYERKKKPIIYWNGRRKIETSTEKKVFFKHKNC